MSAIKFPPEIALICGLILLLVTIVMFIILLRRKRRIKNNRVQSFNFYITIILMLIEITRRANIEN